MGKIVEGVKDHMQYEQSLLYKNYKFKNNNNNKGQVGGNLIPILRLVWRSSFLFLDFSSLICTMGRQQTSQSSVRINLPALINVNIHTILIFINSFILYMWIYIWMDFIL